MTRIEEIQSAIESLPKEEFSRLAAWLHRREDGSRVAPPFEVQVTRDSGMWIAECHALGLVTEAESYEALVQRARQIAPELAELNGLEADPRRLRLRFVEEPADQGDSDTGN